MQQRSNHPGFAEPRASIPHEQDDELEMADEEEEVEGEEEDEEDFDDDGELEDDDVED
jgi:hypothetical protein